MIATTGTAAPAAPGKPAHATGAPGKPERAPGAPSPGTRRPRRPRTVGIALAGCGVVGGELVRLLHERGEGIEAEHGVRLELRRVLVRRPERERPVALAPGVVTADLDAFLATEAEIVVEALGGLDPAERIVRTALEAGRRVVTANKALLAARGASLERLARRGRTRLDFEAAVGGGVPVIRVLRESLSGSAVSRITGVLNGTTNFILTRMAGGASFDAALAEAREKGFAEADATRDLDGSDAADKIAILAWLARGVDPATLPVARRGILPDPDRLVRDARAFGGEVRLLAESRSAAGGVAAAVEPVVVAPGSPFAALRGEENRIEIETERWGGIALSGPGAGGPATAAALLGDILHAAARRRGASAAPTGVADPAPHRWIVSVAATGARAAATTLLDRAGEGAGLPVPALLERAAADAEAVQRDAHTVRLLTGPLSRARLGELVRALEVAGATPVASRCALGEAGRER